MHDDTRLKIIDAALQLAAEKTYLSVGLGDIAARAGVSLADLRARHASRMAILEDFSSLIDERMLAGHDPDMRDEPARERLFDVMMRRFDQLAPYRPGLRGLHRAARRDPLFAMTLNHIAVGSQRWTLASAGLEPTGPFAAPRAMLRAQALVLVAARVLPVFLEDDEAGLPKTMAALDTALKRLDEMAQKIVRFEDACDRIMGRRDRSSRRPGAATAPSAPPETGDMAAAI